MNLHSFLSCERIIYYSKQLQGSKNDPTSWTNIVYVKVTEYTHTMICSAHKTSDWFVFFIIDNRSQNYDIKLG